MKIQITPGYGDAVPGGYNGQLLAEHDGRMAGYIDYQTVNGEPGIHVAMISVRPEYQGRGIATGLLQAAMRECPGPVDPGWQTEQGAAWWDSRGREVAEHYEPPEWTPELPAFDVADRDPEVKL
jgi:GNAT superfamily N-acetyltransferase